MDGTPRDTETLLRRRRINQNGAAIRSIRKLSGYSQASAAQAAGMTQAALSLIESETTCARVETLAKLARVLRVPIGAIMRELDAGDAA